MTRGSTDHSNERRSHNRRIALNAAKAGLPIILCDDDKRPLLPAYQRLDRAISPAEKAEIEAKARADGKPDPAHVGSTRDPAVIRALFRKFPDALPAACAGLGGLVVIDVDSKRDGVNKLEAWMSEQGHVMPADTPVTATQSGGRHFVFRDPSGLGNRAGELAKLGCDVRGRGGVFVLPGAVRLNGAKYRQASDVGLLSAFASDQIPVLPDFFKQAIEAGGAIATVTTDAEIAALVDRLRQTDLPEALDASRFVAEGTDRSAFRLSLANRMRAAGHTAEDYFAALLEAEGAGAYVGEDAPGEAEFNLRNVARDWCQAECRQADNDAIAARLDAAAASAFVSVDDADAAMTAIEAALAAGDDPEDECARLVQALELTDTPADRLAAAQGAVSDLLDARLLGVGEPAALEALRGAIKPAAIGEADDYLPKHMRETKVQGRGYRAESTLFADIDLTAWTIDEILPERGIGFMVGASHTGKTFACLDMMGHLAQGQDWFGRKVYEPTCTLYIGGEDVEEIPGRIKAWTLINGSTVDRVGVMDAPPNLAADPKAIKKIVQVVEHLKADTGLRCGLIVLDTVASLAVGMKENTADEVGQLTDLMRRIGRSTGSAVLGVHHPKKGADSSEGRGSGAFYNNATFEYRLEKKKGARRGTFQVHKNKFAALDMSGLPFQLDPVEIGTNRHGKVVSTLVFGQAEACEFPAVVEDDDAAVVTPEAGDPVQALRGQDRVLAAAKRAIAAQGGPVKRSAIAAEIDADGGVPLSGNSVGPLMARLVEDRALVRDGRLRYGLP